MASPIVTYVQAWNITDAAERAAMLEEALTDDCEVIEPPRRFERGGDTVAMSTG